MKKYLILLSTTIFVFFALGINTNEAFAELVEYGLTEPNDGLLTLDTETGLEWLDLTATQNQSYNSVIGGYGGYTTTYGFRVASASEIETLFQNVGIPDQWSNNAANIPGATDLLLFLGALAEIQYGSPLTQYQSHGMSLPWQPAYPNSPKVSTFFLDYEYQTPISGRAYLDNGGTNMISSFDYRGVFLVREAASPFEPSSPQPSILPPPSIAYPQPVTIDIKPGSYPNSLNINGHGAIPVAILGSADFDVTDINIESLLFNGSEVQVRGKKEKNMCHLEDVSGDFTYPDGAPDGYLDLVCQFEDDPDQWVFSEAEAKVTGELLDGTTIEGNDTIRIVP